MGQSSFSRRCESMDLVSSQETEAKSFGFLFGLLSAGFGPTTLGSLGVDRFILFSGFFCE